MIQADDKRRARLNCIAHLLDQVPYERAEPKRSSCPPGRSPRAMSNRDYPWRFVPERY